jgi:hypothetical protein
VNLALLSETDNSRLTRARLIVLDAPGNADNASGKYTCQIVVSWPIRDGFFGSPAPITVPETDDARMALIKGFAETWAEPFRSLVLGIPPGMEIKSLDLFDWPPPRGLRTSGSVALLGDALHPMAMCRCPLVFFSHLCQPGLRKGR